jgi:hypothetical protein
MIYPFYPFENSFFKTPPLPDGLSEFSGVSAMSPRGIAPRLLSATVFPGIRKCRPDLILILFSPHPAYGQELVFLRARRGI